ncbi:hypothetical protein DFJ74DRAFT_682439 [Hyaloraphidium curvatum]|nr:hypothetical protein DFJ74DRAFT_682439 [Hyaloraphidium curvatum]
MGDLARSVGCGGLARVRVGFRAGLRIPAWYRVEGRIRGTTGDSATSEVRVIDVGTGGVVLEADSDWSRGEPAVVPRPVAPLDGERPLPTAVKRLAELHGVLDRHSVPARFQTMAQKGTVVWAEMLPRGAVASRAQSQLRNASFLFRPDGTIKGYRRFLEVSTPETTDVFLEVAGPQMADRSGAIHPFLLCAASDNACAPITCFAADGVTVTRELEFAVAPGWHGFASGSGGWIHVRGVAGPDSVRGRRVDAAFEIVGAETGEVLATGRAHFVKVASFDGTPPKI